MFLLERRSDKPNLPGLLGFQITLREGGDKETFDAVLAYELYEKG